MLIPRRPQPGNIKVDLSLKLKSDISERLQSGEKKKPAVYTFSVSTKLTKLGISRIQNSYQERLRLMILHPIIKLKINFNPLLK